MRRATSLLPSLLFSALVLLPAHSAGQVPRSEPAASTPEPAPATALGSILGSLNYGWTRAWGGTGTENVNKVAIDAAGNVYVAGDFVGTVDFDPDQVKTDIRTSANGTIDAFLCKFTSDGSLAWVRTWGGGASLNAFTPARDVAYGVAVDQAGGVYVTGAYRYTVDFNPMGGASRTSNATGENNVYLSKFDRDGTFQWVRTWGGNGGAEGYTVAVDNANHVYVVGDFSGTGAFFDTTGPTPSDWHANHATLGGPAFDAFLAKYDSDGAFHWAKTWGGEGYDDGPGVAVDSQGNVYVAGMYASKVIDFDPAGGGATNHPANDSGFLVDVFLSKFDANGQFLWVRTWGAQGTEEATGLVTVDAADAVYVAGRFACINCDFDPGSSADLHSAHEKSPGVGSLDSFLSKFLPDGTFAWARTWGTTGDDQIGGVAVDARGQVLVTGWYAGALRIDAPGGPVDLPFRGKDASGNTDPAGTDAFLLAWDSSGMLLGAASWGGTGAERALALSSRDSRVCVGGRFQGAVDFDPSTAVDTHTATGTSLDAFLTVWELLEAPVVATHPQTTSVATGATATFSASATGLPSPTVRWQVSADGGASWTDIAAANLTSYSFAATPADSGKRYRAVFTNAGGTATSNPATLTVTVANSPVITSVAPSAGPVAGGTTLTITGTGFAPGAAVTIGGAAATGVSVDSTTALTAVTPAHAAGIVDVVVTNTDGKSGSMAGAFTFTTVFRRYFAEGATIPPFDCRFALANPTATNAAVTLRFMTKTREQFSTSIVVPAMGRRTIDAKNVEGLQSAEFSTVVESDVPIVADRTMIWDSGGYGAHAETSVERPALTWYLAEGATHGAFNLFYLLQNPNDSIAQIRVRYLRTSGPPLVKTYTLEAHSRDNIWVDVEEFPANSGNLALASAEVSAVIDVLNDQPIIVERAMYADVPGQFFGAGHESAGVTAPALEWFLAEGATSPPFDLYVLIANPNDVDADVDATFLLPGGATFSRPYTIGANQRFSLCVNGVDPLLRSTSVSTTIRGTNGQPVIVERAMWWGNANGWYEAHNSAGTTTTGTTWALAEGEVDTSRGMDTYILLANTSDWPATVKVTLLYENGDTEERVFSPSDIPARSRFNVPASWFARSQGQRFGAIVESLGTTPAQIVVERAIYWNAVGQAWAAGTNAVATRLR